MRKTVQVGLACWFCIGLDAAAQSAPEVRFAERCTAVHVSGKQWLGGVRRRSAYQVVYLIDPETPETPEESAAREKMISRYVNMMCGEDTSAMLQFERSLPSFSWMERQDYSRGFVVPESSNFWDWVFPSNYKGEFLSLILSRGKERLSVFKEQHLEGSWAGDVHINTDPFLEGWVYGFFGEKFASKRTRTYWDLDSLLVKLKVSNEFLRELARRHAG